MTHTIRGSVLHILISGMGLSALAYGIHTRHTTQHPVHANTVQAHPPVNFTPARHRTTAPDRIAPTPFHFPFRTPVRTLLDYPLHHAPTGLVDCPSEI